MAIESADEKAVGPITVPLVVLSGIGFIVAAVMTATHRHWTAWLAAAHSLIALAGDGPHQVPEILHPESDLARTRVSFYDTNGSSRTETFAYKVSVA